MPLGAAKLVLFKTKVQGVPLYALDFEAGNTDYLKTNSVDFDWDGQASTKKVAVSMWIKMESAATGLRRYFDVRASDGNSSISITQEATGEMGMAFHDGDSERYLIDSAAFTDTTTYHHWYFKFDTTQATESDRFRMWQDGTEITSFSLATYCVQNVDYNSIGTTGVIAVGAAATSGAQLIDGLVYQLGVFNNSLPDISELYDAGSPKDITNVTGLISYLDVLNQDVTNDAKLGTIWDDVATRPDSSATIPA